MTTPKVSTNFGGTLGTKESAVLESEKFVVWLNGQLKIFLGIQNVDELVEHVIALDSVDAENKYFKDLLGNSPKILKFIETYHSKKSKYIAPRKVEIPDDVVIYKKEGHKQPKISKNVIHDTPSIQHNKLKPKVVTKEKSKKEKKEGQYCNCMATKHSLITNCLNCGHIICSKEGTGPCCYCGFSNKKGVIVNSTSLEKAIDHKNQLLEYERTSAQRTIVVDDSSDWFSMNQWITSEEREILQKKEEEEQKKKRRKKEKNNIKF